MQYAAHVYEESGQWLAEFPDAPGCQTFADTREHLPAMAREALEGWLEAHLVDGQSPPRPRAHSAAPRGRQLWNVPVAPGLSVAVQLRWARQDAGITQGQLAKRAGVSQQQIAKLESPDENPTLATIAKVADALGVRVDVELAPAPTDAARSSKRRRAA